MYEHESMHPYFFRVSLVVLNYKQAGFKLVSFRKRRRGHLYPKD